MKKYLPEELKKKRMHLFLYNDSNHKINLISLLP